MKQTIKEETKITTLCRLVAVFNNLLCDKGNYGDRLSVSIGYGIGVRLSVGQNANKRAVYTGSLDGAVAYVAIRLCELSTLPRVIMDVTF